VKKSGLLLYLVLIIISLSIAACTPKSISRAKAIDEAIKGCKQPNHALLGEPYNIGARLMKMKDAMLLLDEPYDGIPIPNDGTVWLVTMEGSMRMIGGVEPTPSKNNDLFTPTPPPPSWSTCYIVIEFYDHNVLKFVHPVISPTAITSP
jgi:hypothetical protein